MENCSNRKETENEAILAFDTLYTTNHMKILKLLLPYLNTENQKKLAVFIKWQELLFTLKFLKHYSAALYSPDFQSKKELDLKLLLPLLSPYCNESERAILSQFSQMQNTMQMMEEMQQYIPLIQQFMSSMSGDSDSSGTGMFQSGDNGMIDLLKNMMSEEQQAMFSMFMDQNL